MFSGWVLVIGLAIGSGNSIATAPHVFPSKDTCLQAGQGWLDKIASLPSELDQWDGRAPAKFLCFEIRYTQ
jgi:hypothetical protein